MTQHEIDRIVASVRDGPEHERLYRDLIRRSGVAISSAESWVLWHVGARGPISADALAARLERDPTGLSALFEALGRRGYLAPDRQGLPDLTSRGRRALIALVKAGQEEVARLLRGREPGEAQARAHVMRRLTRAALTTMPARDRARRLRAVHRQAPSTLTQDSVRISIICSRSSSASGEGLTMMSVW